MLTIQKAGATPNLLKYSVTADKDGGELMVNHETLLKDTARGPLRSFIERAVDLASNEDACQRLLCNPQMRVFVTPRVLARLAVDAVIDEDKALTLVLVAEPGAQAIVALEFRHSLAG